MLWDLNEGKHLYTLQAGDIINALCFSPNRYWLCAAAGPCIRIWVCKIFALESRHSRIDRIVFPSVLIIFLFLKLKVGVPAIKTNF